MLPAERTGKVDDLAGRERRREPAPRLFVE
jgi:hypothetical protein